MGSDARRAPTLRTPGRPPGPNPKDARRAPTLRTPGRPPGPNPKDARTPTGPQP